MKQKLLEKISFNLIGIFNENSELLNAELNCGRVVGHAGADGDEYGDDGVDALVQQRHGRSAVDLKNNEIFLMCLDQGWGADHGSCARTWAIFRPFYRIKKTHSVD